MLTLLKDIECRFADIGVKDILIAGEKIYRITQPGTIKDYSLIEKVIPCKGLYAFAGLIDQHVHILGAGGEQGFASRVCEISAHEILAGGVTTVVGLLGADGCTRSLECLYAKAKALETQGITTFMYSGSYAVPPVTLTGSLLRDIVFIDKVIGAGEIAISDHRSSQPGTGEMLKLSSDAHLGGLLSGKAGVVHLHVGDGKGGLLPLVQMIKESDLPKEQFIPTHTNRNAALFKQAIEYCRFGGNIDLTAGEKAGIPVVEAIRALMEEGIDLSRVTVSSDANGSIPAGGVAKVQSLYDDLRQCIVQSVLSPENAFKLASKNVAKVLKIYPQKGAIFEGSDADILITDKNYEIRIVIGMGKFLLKKWLIKSEQKVKGETNGG